MPEKVGFWKKIEQNTVNVLDVVCGYVCMTVDNSRETLLKSC